MHSHNYHIVPVILCGGFGARLWPLSRKDFPKQFLNLYGNLSLFQNTVIRANSLADEFFNCERIIIVGNELHRFIILDQLSELNLNVKTQLIIETDSKNTAPALTLASLEVSNENLNEILIAMPADHLIKDQGAFIKSIHLAIRQAYLNEIVTLGVLPRSPNIEYGYINFGSKQNNDSYEVLSFTEKPDFETASKYLSIGTYFWNSGIFIIRAHLWIEAIKKCAPDIFKLCNAAWNEKKYDGFFLRPDKNYYKKISGQSIDYAVIEKCFAVNISVSVVQLDSDWDDLGTWSSVGNLYESDANGNLLIGDTLILESTKNTIFANDRLITTIGVNNLMIIDSSDAILIAEKSHLNNIKILTDKLLENNRSEVIEPSLVHRPWGWYKIVEEGVNYKVKRIMVKAGASLSLQRHKHRSEHWIVIKGIATVEYAEKIFQLTVNESSYIAEGQLHRLQNLHDIPLEIIEVQTGKYVGEDDIERFDDKYGRIF
jgi:mannose-1-phosphate guanylyltransferase/mannose-6-phosphate isomerase